MKSIKSLKRESESEYAFATRIGTTQVQLKRWLKNNAHFDSEGDIYIKTKGR